MATRTNFQRALDCAGRGWKVHPVRADKTPYLTDWPRRATSDPVKIRAWWGHDLYRDAEVGILTGKESHLYVVDVDDPEAAKTLGLPLTFGLKVPSRRQGGLHYYFAAPLDGRPVRNRAGGGLDFRGDGGYVIAWNDPPTGTLVPLPAAVAEWARAGRDEGPAAAELPEAIHEGSRETWLMRLAGAMRRVGASVDGIRAALEVENRRCVPMLEHKDLERMSNSTGRYPPARSASRNDARDIVATINSQRSAG